MLLDSGFVLSDDQGRLLFFGPFPAGTVLRELRSSGRVMDGGVYQVAAAVTLTRNVVVADLTSRMIWGEGNLTNGSVPAMLQGSLLSLPGDTLHAVPLNILTIELCYLAVYVAAISTTEGWVGVSTAQPFPV